MTATELEYVHGTTPPPVWEYRTASSIEALNARAMDGWRLHTAVPFVTHIEYVLERRRA